jgi:glycosyltransferase involved in cell wall biosynthesis
MKITIITAVYNNAENIAQAINSVFAQDYPNIEYIIIDGASSDGTKEIIEAQLMHRPLHMSVEFISERDNGVYDALNKGLHRASGDFIGQLHSDDFYPSNTIISEIVSHLLLSGSDCIFGDLIIVKRKCSNKVTRFYSGAKFYPERLAYGWMPPHPTFFLRREHFENYGYYKTDYKIAADYEIMVRMLYVRRISYSYMPKIIVNMREGGISSKNLRNRWILNREIVRSCLENGIYTNMWRMMMKIPSKLMEKIRRPLKSRNNQKDSAKSISS